MKRRSLIGEHTYLLQRPLVIHRIFKQIISLNEGVNICETVGQYNEKENR